jgi:hypothetical protein
MSMAEKVVKNKDTGENVIKVEEWLATINNPEYTNAWNTRSASGDSTVFDQMWDAYMQAVNGVWVDGVDD